MAVAQSLPELLNSLTSSLTTLSTSLTSADSIKQPEDGISLLDTKNELFLSYLQNLVFLILLKLRNAKSHFNEDTPTENGTHTLERETADETVRRLVELRVYLDRGVKPLETKLRYQIDRAVQAANDQEARSQQQKTDRTKKNKKISRASDSDSDSDATDSDTNSSASDSDASSDANNAISHSNLASMTARPNGLSSQKSARLSSSTTSAAAAPAGSAGVYRPPRVRAIAPPSDILDPTSRDKSKANSNRPAKSKLLDEYISAEVSGAPVAEPSIGANILNRGRGDVQSARERRIAEDRQRYEEENLVRLPGMGKKEKRKMEGERVRRGQFGGEEWGGLGGSADRIVELTSRGGARGVRGALERSRKRGREGDDGRSDGRGIGVEFEKRRRMLEKRAQRKK